MFEILFILFELEVIFFLYDVVLSVLHCQQRYIVDGNMSKKVKRTTINYVYALNKNNVIYNDTHSVEQMLKYLNKNCLLRFETSMVSMSMISIFLNPSNACKQSEFTIATKHHLLLYSRDSVLKRGNTLNVYIFEITILESWCDCVHISLNTYTRDSYCTTIQWCLMR